jgi:hypothetical protein
VQEAVELILHRVDDGFLSVPNVQASDATGEVEIAIAVDILEPRVFGFGYIDWRAVRKAAGHSLGAALGESLGLRTGDGCAELNG